MTTPHDTGVATRALIYALIALACGHMLSTLLRTIPAVSLDLMAADFHIEPQALASLTSFHFEDTRIVGIGYQEPAAHLIALSPDADQARGA